MKLFKGRGNINYNFLYYSISGVIYPKIFHFNVPYPFLTALAIGFVDALPILGSGTVMVPWAIIEALNGDINLGIAIIVILQ